ncbi:MULTISPECIES: hypothetical protein [Acidithiobacillus]|uniref:hypothetical protein n=1 Tax=Acidithiobacillus TaxID=119977 RepID=UPI000A7B720E|nr:MULTISPECIES: hypothetical protein [Acidithiobacillus]
MTKNGVFECRDPSKILAMDNAVQKSLLQDEGKNAGMGLDAFKLPAEKLFAA